MGQFNNKSSGQGANPYRRAERHDPVRFRGRQYSLDERRISGLFVICGSDPVLEKEDGIEEFRITEDRISSSGIGNCFRAFLMKRIREKLGITEIYISG
jgi:hypothetical protein